MGHPVLNPGKHHITGVNLQSFLLQEQSGKLMLFQITCCAYLLAVNYPQLRHLAILQESKIIAGWVESVKTGVGECFGDSLSSSRTAKRKTNLSAFCALLDDPG